MSTGTLAEMVQAGPAARHPLLPILAMLRLHAWQGFEVLGCLLLMALCDLALPFATQRLIDDVIPNHDVRGLVSWIAALAVAVLVGALVSYRRIVIASTMAARVLAELRQRCVEKYCSLSPRFLDHVPSGDLLSRITNDVDHLHGVIERILPALIFETATLIALAVYALYLNALMTLVVLGIGAPLFGAMYLTTSRRLRQNSRSLQDSMGRLSETVNEQLTNQTIIVSFDLRAWAQHVVLGVLRRILSTSIQVARIDASLTAGTHLVFQGTRIVVLAIGIVLIFRGDMTVGALVAFLAVVSGLIAPFVTIADYYGELSIAAGALERVQSFLQTSDHVHDGSATFERPIGEIELHDVSVAYVVGTDVLKRVSAVIPAGSVVALVGPSGSGKTTFLHLLMRFLDPNTGSVSVAGRDLRSFSVDSWRNHVALVPQTPLLFNVSAAENVRLGRLDASAEEINAALRAAALDTAIELPHLAGDEAIGEGGALLSAGQRQRLTIARALVRNAELLLLDEATSSLDPERELAVLEGLAACRRADRTIIFSTHRVGAAARADVVLSFAAGRVVRIR